MAELLRDNLHNNTRKAYNKEGVLVNYPVRLELMHVLLNLKYAQLALHGRARSRPARG